MPSSHTLLQNALFLDTETLGLDRGSGLHELAVYDLESRTLHEYILKPNMVNVATATAQESTRLATSSLDIHKLISDKNWLNIIRRQLYQQGHIPKANASNVQVMQALKVASPWLYKKMHAYPHLLGKTLSANEEQARTQLLKEMGGVENFTSEVIDPRDLLKAGGTLQRMIEGKTIWGANMAFDSKQIGALVGGLEAEGIPTELKKTLQTIGTTVDPFYVTGVEVNKAKVEAQQTGDWTGVWKAYLADTPKPGQTAVRDIQDVLRAMMSYGQKLGLSKAGDVYWGTSLDIVYRLMGSLDKNKGRENLLLAESHRAAEDIAIHSRYVLERALNWTSALQEVSENTNKGRSLLELAGKEQGPLYEAAAFLGRQELVRQPLLEKSLIQRLARAQYDIIDQGKTWQVDGWDEVERLTQMTPEGRAVKVPFLNPNRVAMTNMNDVVKFLVDSGKYGPDIDVAAQATSLSNALGKGQNEVEQKRILSQYLEQKTDGLVEGKIAAAQDNILNFYNRNIGKTVTQSRTTGKMIGEAASVLKYASVPGLMKHWGMFAGATAAMGATWSLASGSAEPVRDQPSLVTYNYRQWKQHQNEIFGMKDETEMPGMSETGLMSKLRSAVTDFGSPYQGIMGSQVVFAEQELLKEREKWLREQYGAIHYDPMSGLFGMQGILTRARHAGYSYIGDGTPVANGYMNLRGEHLMKVNLGDGNWKMNVEDADTITLKRGGLRGAVSSLFGLNKGYSFRLAGIDAPEIAHGDRAAQPYSMEALEGLRAMLGKDKNIEVVFDPSQTTYGRTMGVIFSDNKNVNYDLIKRGLVSHLGYGKASDSMIDYSIMRSMETANAAAGRGMWQHPYWKTMYDVTKKNGQRLTHNTLTQPDKLVENQWKMDMVSMMEQAEASGMYSTAMAMEASRIGNFSKGFGPDKVRPVITGERASHYNSYLHEILSDNDKWIKTKGSGYNSNKFSSRGNYGDSDKALVLDSLQQTNSIWSRRKLHAFNRYQSNSDDGMRKQAMASMQINALQSLDGRDPGRYYQ